MVRAAFASIFAFSRLVDICGCDMEEAAAEAGAVAEEEEEGSPMTST